MLSIGENPFEKGLFLSVSFADAEPLSENFNFFWAGGSYVCKHSYPPVFFCLKKNYPLPKRDKSLFESTKAKPLQTGSGDNFSSEKFPPINNINFCMGTRLNGSTGYYSVTLSILYT